MNSTTGVRGDLADPRPDIWWDSVLWVAVLAAAQTVDEEANTGSSIVGLLHGLRCAGARLHWSAKNRLRIDYNALIATGDWAEIELRQKWLIPAATAIKAVFNIVEIKAGVGQPLEPLPQAAGF